jgi:histidinol-phosphate aminotransferase
MIAVASYEQRRIASGVLPLDHNEGPAPASAVVRALAQLDAEMLRRYRTARDLEELIAASFGVRAEQVIVTAGGDEAIDRCVRAYLAPDRAMILPEPTFEMFRRYAALARAEIVNVPWPPGSFPTEAVLATIERCGARVTLIPIVTPNNPTGETASADDLVAIARAAPNALVVLDHAYVEYGAADLTALALELENTVVIRTFSKARGLAGCRVGFTLGNQTTIAALRAAGSPYPVAAPSLALAAVQWQSGGESMVAAVRQTVRERDRLAQLFRDAGYAPRHSAANFLTVDLRERAAALHEWLLASCFAVRLLGGPLAGSVRITMPVDEGAFERLRVLITEWLHRTCEPQRGGSR